MMVAVARVLATETVRMTSRVNLRITDSPAGNQGMITLTAVANP
jgi:hypothetical protein